MHSQKIKNEHLVSTSILALLFSQVQRSNEEVVIFSSSAEWWQSILHTYVLRAWGLMT
jgi:hypothetical protein